MRNKFRFKQFSLQDSHSAMKLTTDAVLLGASVKLDNPEHILDIGTGSGIIALMLAQRSLAKITGIDPDKGSIKDAKANFENSPWKNRLTAIKTNLQTFTKTTDKTFDLVVSNPPFFLNSKPSPRVQNNVARHNENQFFDLLMQKTAQLMVETGYCSFIVADSSIEMLDHFARQHSLNCRRRISILPKRSKPCNRVITEYDFSPEKELHVDELVIRNEDNTFTSSYRSLTKDFYLDF